MTTIRDLLESGKITPDTVVLGELPMTADGVIVGTACTVWYEDHNWQTMRRPQFIERAVHYPINLGRAYSTSEAAEAARSKK